MARRWKKKLPKPFYSLEVYFCSCCFGNSLHHRAFCLIQSELVWHPSEKRTRRKAKSKLKIEGAQPKENIETLPISTCAGCRQRRRPRFLRQTVYAIKKCAKKQIKFRKSKSHAILRLCAPCIVDSLAESWATIVPNEILSLSGLFFVF